MEIITIVLLCVCILTSVVGIVVAFKTKSSTSISREDKDDIKNGFNNSMDFMGNKLTEMQRLSSDAFIQNLKIFQENMSANSTALEKRVLEITKQLDERMQNISKMQEEKLEAMRQSNERHLKAMQEDNNQQLDKMRATVDEKLAKTINERFEQSFQVLSKQLESVYKSLGEMQNIATDVGSLTKMLSNVKTTGVFGEIQLGAIFDQLLAREQYETNIVTGEANEPVEFAIKLPGQSEGEFVYLPVDSKFPYTLFSDLQTSYESNDFEAVKQKKEQLKTRIKGMAKDIQTKYICPPGTTNFAIMFLPVESLYAEVAKMGLIEELQKTYSVTVAGPTTMSALLNSLQMGFKTLAIQKKSGEVWKILGAVRTEFEKFSGIVENIHKQFEKTSQDFDKLVGTRTRLLASKLRAVEKLDGASTTALLGLDEVSGADSEE